MAALPLQRFNDLTSIAMRTFNFNTLYKPLHSGIFTEESILSLLKIMMSRHETAPRAERESLKPLRIAALLSQGQC